MSWKKKIHPSPNYTRERLPSISETQHSNVAMNKTHERDSKPRKSGLSTVSIKTDTKEIPSTSGQSVPQHRRDLDDDHHIRYSESFRKKVSDKLAEKERDHLASEDKEPVKSKERYGVHAKSSDERILHLIAERKEEHMQRLLGIEIPDKKTMSAHERKDESSSYEKVLKVEDLAPTSEREGHSPTNGYAGLLHKNRDEGNRSGQSNTKYSQTNFSVKPDESISFTRGFDESVSRKDIRIHVMSAAADDSGGSTPVHTDRKGSQRPSIFSADAHQGSLIQSSFRIRKDSRRTSQDGSNLPQRRKDSRRDSTKSRMNSIQGALPNITSGMLAMGNFSTFSYLDSEDRPQHQIGRQRSTLREMTRQRMYQDSKIFQQEIANNMMAFGDEARAEQGELIDTLTGASQGEKDKEKDSKNVRAHMGLWNLLVHDFKVWRMRRARSKFKHEANPLFSHQIRTIEGMFGSGVVSFFVFLRWMIEMNLALCALWFLLVAVPNAVVFERQTWDRSSVSEQFYLRNLLDGGGYWRNTLLFYGAYEPTANSYPIALMYLLCIFITYFGGFSVVLKSIASAIQEDGITSRGSQFTFARILFSSWDYSLMSKMAAENLSRGIGQSFRDIMTEIHTQQLLESRSKKQRLNIFLRRLFAWVTTMLLLAGGSASIFMFVNTDMVELLSSMGLSASSESFLVVYTPSLVFVVINTVIPQILFLLPALEHYAQGKVQLYVTICRVFVLRMVNVIALLVSLHIKIENDRFTGCAGTLIGQELYRLIVLDTIIQVFAITLPRYAYFYWTKEQEEFTMPPLVLKLLYRQALIWLGTMFSPVMPLIGCISMLILFITSYMMVVKTCKPPSKRWNQPRRSTFFMGLTAATLAILIIIVSMVITRSDVVKIGQVGRYPELSCGPFGNSTMISVYTRFKNSLGVKHKGLFKFLEVITSVSVIVPLIFVLIAFVYFQHVRIRWEEKRNKEITKELVVEQEIGRNLMITLHESGIGEDKWNK